MALWMKKACVVMQRASITSTRVHGGQSRTTGLSFRMSFGYDAACIALYCTKEIIYGRLAVVEIGAASSGGNFVQLFRAFLSEFNAPH